VAVASYLDDISLKDVLHEVVILMSRIKRDSVRRGFFIVARRLKEVKVTLQLLSNHSKRIPGSLRFGFMAGITQFFIYYVTQVALAGKLEFGHSAWRWFLHNERVVWQLFSEMYRYALGRIDVNRCMEGEPWYAHIAAVLRGAQEQSASGGVTLVNSGSASRDQMVVAQGCDQLDVEQIGIGASVSLFLTTGCVSGDIAAGLLLLQNCILEHDVHKTLQVYGSLFALATLAFSAHDFTFWTFHVRDIAIGFANALLTFARMPKKNAWFSHEIVEQLLWVVHKIDIENDSVYRYLPVEGCGPHVLKGPLMLEKPLVLKASVRSLVDAQSNLVEHDAGPVCTEFGRFWVPIWTSRVEDLSSVSLVVIVITTASWPNPWHHSHWWIPAIWYIGVQLRLKPAEVQFGLVFAHENSSFSSVVQASFDNKVKHKLKLMERAEPEEWSSAQYYWPRRKKKKAHGDPKRFFSLQGLHGELITLLSSHTAKPLSELYGRPYREIIVGQLPLRWTLNTPGMSCGQIRAAVSFVRGTRRFREVISRPRRTTSPRQNRITLLFIQRQHEEGRFLANLPALMTLLRKKLRDKLMLDIVNSSLPRTTWVEQFARFSSSSILAGAEGGAMGWLWTLPHGGVVMEFRSYETPSWVPCSDKWNDPATSGGTFPGMAKISGIHHICLRSWLPAPYSQPNAGVQQGDHGYYKGAAIMLDVGRIYGKVKQALALISGSKPPC